MNQHVLTPNQAGYLAGVLSEYLSSNAKAINPSQMKEAQALVKYLNNPPKE